MFILSRCDTEEALLRRSEFWTEGYVMTIEVPKDLGELTKLRQGFENLLKAIDELMTSLILRDGNDGDLVNWAARVKICGEKLNALDRNIPFAGKRQWNGAEVFGSLGFIKAVIEGAELTLADNGIEFKKSAEVKQPATV